MDPDWFKSRLVLSVWILAVSPVSVRWTHRLTGDSKLTVRVCLSVSVRVLSQSEILRQVFLSLWMAHRRPGG